MYYIYIYMCECLYGNMGACTDESMDIGIVSRPNISHQRASGVVRARHIIEGQSSKRDTQ